jgi:hypothetical protein
MADFLAKPLDWDFREAVLRERAAVFVAWVEANGGVFPRVDGSGLG